VCQAQKGEHQAVTREPDHAGPGFRTATWFIWAQAVVLVAMHSPCNAVWCNILFRTGLAHCIGTSFSLQGVYFIWGSNPLPLTTGGRCGDWIDTNRHTG
jgi:hypothetical protein